MYMYVYEIENKKDTSTSATKTDAIIAKVWPASKVGAPHCRGYGIMILEEKVIWDHFSLKFLEGKSAKRHNKFIIIPKIPLNF